ncbi:MAG: hypothetical protein ACR2QJ_11400 [Geminicoccaceae bacterium]
MISGAIEAAGGAYELIAPPLVLSGLYTSLAFLLLGLQLRSGWSWPMKTAAICLTLPATIGTFLAIQAHLGWPSDASLPPRFQLHAALIDEPAAAQDGDGAIFLWLTPMTDAPSDDRAVAETSARPERRPRAFDLPYTRELHREVDSMRERLARGDLVVGRHEAVAGWQQRFGQSDGQTNLEAPPPPPLPKKDG